MELFTTEDVHTIMMTTLNEKNYYNIDSKAKGNVFTECLNTYLLYKLTQLNGKSYTDLNDVNIYELFSLIESNIEKTVRMEYLSPIINYLLNFISNMQNHDIKWQIDETNLLSEIIMLNESTIDILKSSLKTSMSNVFNTIYNYLLKQLGLRQEI